MSKGISIHIGVNAVDPTHYGTNGTLKGCENDAKAMKKIAQDLGYESTMLLTKDATSTRVLSELHRASQQLSKGDTLLLTYAGHGAQVPDVNNEEQDRQDETWCLYDRMLLDDELHSAWARFNPGVKITVVSDSCHSGTITRVLFADVMENYASTIAYRCLDPQVALATYTKYDYLYCGIKYGIPRSIQKEIGATILLLSGCQDNQLSGDGDVNGLFTSHLLRVWDNGNFAGSYNEFHQQICSKMPPLQTPNYLVIGTANAVFEKQKPFVLSGTRIIEGDQPFSLGQPRKLTWSLDIDENTVLGMSDDQLQLHLKNMVDLALIPAYEKFRILGSQIILPRGGEIHGGCTVGDKGWSCGVGGSIRF